MKKRNRTHHNYSKYATVWNGTEIADNDERYYGLHRDGDRVKIDLKRIKKLKCLDIPETVLQKASQIPRNTVYFLPQKVHRSDYTVNQFRDKLTQLADSWRELKTAFTRLDMPNDVAERVRTASLMDGIMDYEEASFAGLLASVKREKTVRRLWNTQCSQFILQMATELDALLLRRCRYLGFAEKEVSRGKLHTYLDGTQKGRVRVQDLPYFKEVYKKFFTVYNFLKHNSEDLFEKVRLEYPEMLLSTAYCGGEMAQNYLKIDNTYIEEMLKDLLPFYEALCKEFFDEDLDAATWNYDDYFVSAVREWISFLDNPLGLPM